MSSTLESQIGTLFEVLEFYSWNVIINLALEFQKLQSY